MSFPSKSGCPLCSIVARGTTTTTTTSSQPNSPPTAVGSPISSSSPSSFSTARVASASANRSKSKKGGEKEPEIVWQDENFTVYRERAHPVSSVVHLVVVFNLHVPSLYMLSASDVPLLINLRDLTHRLLSLHLPTPSPLPTSSPPASPTPTPSTSALPHQDQEPSQPQSAFRVGFITPPWKDSYLPVKDHLHAHAYVAPADLCGWWRSVAFGPLAWYAVEDLIAEIREESTNNRIRSATNANARPIDRIPAAGARSGTASGHETTREGLAVDLEAGNGNGNRNGLLRRSSGSSETTYRRERSPLTEPSPARLAAPSHLDLSATLSSTSASVAGPSSSGSPLQSSVGFEYGRRATSPVFVHGGGEKQPGSSFGPSGQLLSPRTRSSS